MAANDPKPSAQIDAILDGKLREEAREGRPVPRTTVESKTPAGSVTVVVEEADRLGVLAGSIGAQRRGGRPSDVAAQAQDAVRRLNYLQEPLAVIESEARRARTILRSAAPRKVEGGREYNEAVLDGGGSITIRRFRAEPGARRRQVPSNISRETLGRLADDLSDILEPRS